MLYIQNRINTALDLLPNIKIGSPAVKDGPTDPKDLGRLVIYQGGCDKHLCDRYDHEHIKCLFTSMVLADYY